MPWLPDPHHTWTDPLWDGSLSWMVSSAPRTTASRACQREAQGSLELESCVWTDDWHSTCLPQALPGAQFKVVHPTRTSKHWAEDVAAFPEAIPLENYSLHEIFISCTGGPRTALPSPAIQPLLFHRTPGKGSHKESLHCVPKALLVPACQWSSAPQSLGHWHSICFSPKTPK
jgi:hypothetical protein